MNGRYPEARAPWGPTARARPPGWTADPPTSGAVTARAAPSLRERVPGPAPGAPEKFERYETITFTLAAVAAVQAAGRFSGTPDGIDLFASAAGVDVFLADQVGREESSIRLPALLWVETRLSRRMVFVQDTTGAGTQVIRAVGKWAARGE